MTCIFCHIISGEVPTEPVYQDDKVVAIRDIRPQAPVHLLIMPRKHIPQFNDLADNEMPLINEMASVAKELAKKEEVSEKGYRLVINCGSEGGQAVAHLHMHLLGGHQLSDSIG